MASERRLERLQSFILREATAIFQKGLNDPRIGAVTVSRVSLSKDLRYCTLFVVLQGDETAQRTTFRGLQSATATVQYKLAQVLELRFSPQISFEIDTHPEKAQEMDDIFRKIAEERGEDPEDDES